MTDHEATWTSSPCFPNWMADEYHMLYLHSYRSRQQFHLLLDQLKIRGTFGSKLWCNVFTAAKKASRSQVDDYLLPCNQYIAEGFEESENLRQISDYQSHNLLFGLYHFRYCAFTIVEGSDNPSITACAISIPTRCCASNVAAPIYGVPWKFSCCNRG